jgi:hydroxymethylbilane synthase
MQTYKVGTRTSPLALRQVEEVSAALKKSFPTLEAEIVGIDTYGDQDKATPISQIEGTDFFTREIDTALLAGRIDFAVHSAKDLPDNIRQGLAVAAITASVDPYDALVSKSGLNLDQLPNAAKIGTSSSRRKNQLTQYRPDLKILDLRGNIEQRLEKLNHSALDGIVIAACGLIRLGLENRITQRIPFAILKPHPLQGALAAVTRADDLELINLLSVISCKEVSRA